MKLYTLLFLPTAYASLRGIVNQSDNSDNVTHRSLQVTVTSCTYKAVVDAFGSSAAAATALGVTDDATEIKNALTAKCGAATTPTLDFEKVLGEGPQHVKNFFDGDGKWNDKENLGANYNRAEDAYILQKAFDGVSKNTVIKLPEIENFKECKHQAAYCCWQEAEKNTDVCAVDVYRNPTTNHVKDAGKQWAIINDLTSASNCKGFTWASHGTKANLAGNALFYTVYEGFYKSGFTKNTVGSPMCGCMEQMPVVTNVDCVEVKESYTIGGGSVTLGPITYGACSVPSVKEKMSQMVKDGDAPKFQETILGWQISESCDAGIKQFLSTKGYVKSS
jgi:hypothetical protein